jgi:hypothetical protein
VRDRTLERLPGSTIGQRKVLQLAAAEKIHISVDSKLPGYFERGANRRLRYADVDACEANGWIERTARGTFRITEAGRAQLPGFEGVTLSTVQQRINNESRVST